jgi:3-oxoacyl-[acyl-carrier-protein] synthase III
MRIAGIARCLPPSIRSSRDVEERIRANSPRFPVPDGIVEQVTGVRNRRVVCDGVYSSDLAAGAGLQVLRATDCDPARVDLLIFASASQDLIEPATANIVQEKVGTSCPVFDIKNACNSFLNALQVGEALIAAGSYSTVLVTTGETPSQGINWSVENRKSFRRSFIGYTFGDAGAAALLTRSAENDGFFYQSFNSISRHWPIATIPGGGSMHPRGEEFSYFRGDGKLLRQAFLDVGPEPLEQALEATHTHIEDYGAILVHQVSVPALTGFIRSTGVPRNRVVESVSEYGNMAAASLPVAFSLAEERGCIRRGDLVMWVGLAAGISVCVTLMRY